MSTNVSGRQSKSSRFQRGFDHDNRFWTYTVQSRQFGFRRAGKVVQREVSGGKECAGCRTPCSFGEIVDGFALGVR